MRIVLGHHALVVPGGSETYLLTVAEQLERLGHESTLYAHEVGEMADAARERGVDVCDSAKRLPDSCDAVLAQDGPMAYELAERYPGASRVYVAHSAEFLVQAPPQLPDVCGAVVVLNDRVRRRVDRLAGRPPLVRLRQPIDLDRFGRFTRASREPRHVLVIGNSQGGPRYEQLARCCDRLGMSVSLVGRFGESTPDPAAAIRRADIVVAIGRCVIEAMASRKAAYVHGLVGTDGWVTPDSYPALEADGFSGRATDSTVGEERLLRDLAEWTPELGELGADLARLHHDAADHAVELVGLWERLGGGAYQPSAPADELARLVRVGAQAESRTGALAFEAAQAVDERDELVREVERLNRHIAELKATRRWRFAQAISAPLEGARAIRRRLADGRGNGPESPPPPGESHSAP